MDSQKYILVDPFQRAVHIKKASKLQKNGKPRNKKPESSVIYLFSIYCVKIVTILNSK